jgi:hypothetical protein
MTTKDDVLRVLRNFYSTKDYSLQETLDGLEEIEEEIYILKDAIQIDIAEENKDDC